jgi:circadian clock protein KaiB
MSDDIRKTFEDALSDSENDHYILSLYITGVTPKSSRAIANIKLICEEYLHGRYELEVIDIYQQPELALREDLLVAPTLIKSLPLPLRKLVGDMSNEDKVLAGLGLRKQKL